MVTATLYLRKVPSNHYIAGKLTSCSTEIVVAMVTVIPTVSDNEFYFCYAVAGSKCEMLYFGFVSGTR